MPDLHHKSVYIDALIVAATSVMSLGGLAIKGRHESVPLGLERTVWQEWKPQEGQTLQLRRSAGSPTEDPKRRLKFVARIGFVQG